MFLLHAQRYAAFCSSEKLECSIEQLGVVTSPEKISSSVEAVGCGREVVTGADEEGRLLQPHPPHPPPLLLLLPPPQPHPVFEACFTGA